MEISANVQVAAPSEIRPNPENPRLVFRERELLELENSIAANGILVPLTVYAASSGGFVLLDGERRWRCARKLNLHRVPVIVQPEPTLIQNIMMMFAIHNARTEWDPYPTALKLQQLEHLYSEAEGAAPTEGQLAQIASLTRGEVRRLKNILSLPDEYLRLIRDEQDLPRSEQTLTVDHLLEVTRGGKALFRENIVDGVGREALELALIAKFKSQVLTSTVEPRLLSRMARAVERGDVPASAVQHAVRRLADDPAYTVRQAFASTVEHAEQDHNLELASRRLYSGVSALSETASFSEATRESLAALRDLLDRLLRR